MTASSPSPLLRRGAWFAGLALAAASGAILSDAWVPFGKVAVGARRDRVEASPQWQIDRFVNPQPMWNDVLGSLSSFLDASPVAQPDAPIPVVTGTRERFALPPSTGLRVTWLGHSTQLIEIDGLTILTDPIFGGRASPLTWAGPETWYEPPIPLAELPPIDAVLISHDHYDHLQLPTIKAMRGWETQFIVPLGVGAHLEYWGIDPARITELDWWEETQVGELRVVGTPARHASGRQAFDQNETLWLGFALIGPQHRVFFSGDTGLFPALDEIGERLGPFDVTMFEVGAYNAAWPDWHLGPEQAVRAHQMVRGELMMPVHWGLWSLAMHGWTEPVERVLVEAEVQGVEVFVPRPGQSFEPADLPPLERWWPELPWQTAAQAPIVVSTPGAWEE